MRRLGRIFKVLVVFLMSLFLFCVVLTQKTDEKILTTEEQNILKEELALAAIEAAVEEDANTPGPDGSDPVEGSWRRGPRFAVSPAGCRDLAEVKSSQILFAKFDLTTAQETVLEDGQKFYVQYYRLADHGPRWTQKPKVIRAGTAVLVDAEKNMILARCCNGLSPPGTLPPRSPFGPIPPVAALPPGYPGYPGYPEHPPEEDFAFAGLPPIGPPGNVLRPSAPSTPPSGLSAVPFGSFFPPSSFGFSPPTAVIASLPAVETPSGGPPAENPLETNLDWPQPPQMSPPPEVQPTGFLPGETPPAIISSLSPIDSIPPPAEWPIVPIPPPITPTKPIPEPSTVVLFILGISTLYFFLRKKKPLRR